MLRNNETSDCTESNFYALMDLGIVNFRIPAAGISYNL